MRQATTPAVVETPAITIRIYPLHGDIRNVRVPVDSTIAQVLDIAGYPSDTTVRHNDEVVTNHENMVDDNDQLDVISSSKIVSGN